MNTPDYDLIVFGATGFVGRLVTDYLARHTEIESDLKWALAGRSEAKLRELAASVASGGREVPIVVAHSDDAASLSTMCRRTKVVISTVGPYDLYGEPLVQACVDTGTDYCDLTGEISWVRRMLDRYEKSAADSGARIVHSCGFDSIPSDMGVYFLQQQAHQRFGLYCSQVNMRVKNIKGGASGGTIASFINELRKAGRDKQVRKTLADPYSLCPPEFSTRVPQHSLLSARYEEAFSAWAAPFAMAVVNEHVVLRSNALADPRHNDELIYNEGVLTGKGFKGRMHAGVMTFAMGAFMMAILIPQLRRLLERFILPKPGQGPSPESRQKGFFNILFHGRTPEGQTLKIRVTGDRDPGYAATSKMLTQAAICLARDISKQEKPGGFWTPSTIFGDRLIERLRAHAGMTFDLIE